MCAGEGPSKVHIKCFGPKEGGMDFLGECGLEWDGYVIARV